MEHRQTWDLIFCISEGKCLVAQSVSNSANESSFPFFLFLMTEVISWCVIHAAIAFLRVVVELSKSTEITVLSGV